MIPQLSLSQSGIWNIPDTLVEEESSLNIQGLDVESPEAEFQTIREMDKKTFDFLTQEFKNHAGNRYNDVIPYENRVKLQSGDYINASLVSMPEGETYICAQGPLPNTISQFWEMIWQEDVQVIVMVADLREGIIVKCAQYWPKLGVTDKFDDIEVQCISEKFRYAGSPFEDEEGLTLRTFKLKNGTSEKIVYQLKYENWKDHEIANLDLVSQLIDEANTLRKIKDKPLLVHCSAGIGRTGTFVAEHHLCSQIDLAISEKICPVVDVRKTVIQLRNVQTGRVNMVQNKKQYSHIYHLLRKRYGHIEFSAVESPKRHLLKMSK